MTSPLTVSAVIPNYNYGRFLGDAIRSVLEQTQPPEQVIVVDDGSSDDSVSVAESFGARVEVVRQKNKGVSAARNAGIARAQSDLVAFLDSDDVWLPQKLELQVQKFAQPDVVMVYGGCIEVDANGNEIGRFVPRLRGRLPGLFDQGPGNHFRTPSGAVVRRRTLSEIGGFSEHLSNWADWDLWKRISGQFSVDFVSDPVLLYRVHATSMSRNPARLESEMERILAEHYPRARGTNDSGPWGPIRSRWLMMMAGDYFHAGRTYDTFRLLSRACREAPASVLGFFLGWPGRRFGGRNPWAL